MGKASLLRFSCPIWNGLDVKLGVVAVLTEVYHTVYSAIWGQYGCKQCCFGAICLHTMLFWGSMPAYSTVLGQYAGLQCCFGAAYNAVLGQYACIQCYFGAICLHTVLFGGNMPTYNAILGQYACIQYCFVAICWLTMLFWGSIQCCFGAVCLYTRLFCHAASWTGTVLWFTSSELGKAADIQMAMVWVQPEESLAAVVVAFPSRMLWGSPHMFCNRTLAYVSHWNFLLS